MSGDLLPLSAPPPERSAPVPSTPPAAEAVRPVLGPDTAAATIAGISRSHLHRLRVAGLFGPRAVKLGRRLLFNLDECRRWAQSPLPNGRLPNAREWQAMEQAERRRQRRNAV
jgi:hypothetical protein